jgi:DNA-binding NtrC family response regulator
MSDEPKILVVDDHENICDSVSKILSRKGYQVDCTTSAEDAITKIKQTKYKLVIVDVMMPKVSGIDLLKTIRKEYNECNVIMITGYPSIESAVEAARSGANDYVPKPFTPDELIDVVKKTLEKHKPGVTTGQKKLIWYFEKNNNVLVVDDESVICNSIKKILSNDGYFVDCAMTTEEALTKLETKKYALACLDLKIPSVGGVELLRNITAKWPDTRAIIITGYASIDSAVETTKLGAAAYLQKPFTPEELKKVVRDAMSHKAI